jgi:hypothetical protein
VGCACGSCRHCMGMPVHVYYIVWQLNSGFRGGVLILTIMIPPFLSSTCDQKILGFCQQPFIFFSSFFRFFSLISALPLHIFKAALLYVFLSNLFSIFFLFILFWIARGIGVFFQFHPHLIFFTCQIRSSFSMFFKSFS